MAHRALLGNKHMFEYVSKGKQFKYLLVLDFEATCEKNVLIQPQEIIEFPCMALSTHDWQVKDIFHEYVKPRVNPNLTSFCTELTGIMQEMVDDQSYFPEVLTNFSKWIEKGKYFEEKGDSAFVTCGDWDLKVMIPSQCAIDKIKVPEYFEKWINLKWTFCSIMKTYPHGITDMLMRLNLQNIGRLHSGIDDVKNMVNIIKTLGTHHNTCFDITSGADFPNLPLYKKNIQKM